MPRLVGLLAAALLLPSIACKPVESARPPEDAPLIESPDGVDAQEADPTSTAADRTSRPPQTIYRSELARALSGGPAYLLRELGPEPFRMNGKFVGWEITQVYPDDPELCAPGCGIQAGDVILSVNGSRLETPQQLSDFLEQLPRLRAIEVTSLREEQRRKVTYTIVDDG